MKNLTKILTFLIAVLMMGCSYQVSKNRSSDLNQNQIKKYEKIFKDLKESLVKDSANKLWNHPLYGPLMFINPKTRLVIANQADDKGVLKKSGTVYTGFLPKEISVANSTTDWGGKKWAMVMLPLPDDYYARMNLIIHESFHRIQQDVGFADLNAEQNNHLDEMNGRIYLKLELEALKSGLMTDNKTERQQSIRDALLFRLYRYELYPGAKESENYLELKEGLAEYTGSILSGRTHEALTKHYVYFINNFYQNPTYVRSFAYATIPAYGYLMSLKDKYWNQQVSDETNLTDFMMNFFHVKVPNDLNKAIAQIRNHYGYDQIAAFEMKRSNMLKKEMAAYEKKFIKDTTLIIKLVKMKIRFDPRNTVPFKNLGIIYPSMRIVDVWGILNVVEGGGLVVNWQEAVVSAPTSISDTLVKGNGWNLELNKGWQVTRNGKHYTLELK